ncbi:LysR family transcriptional regulator [Gryllotalpicola daejeonensis]|uniref:LysR family transcriptional regulator n=1 Tax=Gryllotalpicola daejeonensis TaxID=993087 RepID=A0ABP7ZK16_9MICO
MTLRLLTALAEVGSISAASRRVGISQQAASMRMRQLEQRLGIALLQRAARGTALTSEGAVTAEWAAEIVEAADRFEAGVAALREQRAPLSVASSLTVAEYLLPRWLIAARAVAAPDRGVSITATHSTQVIELVTSGRCGLGFIESPQSVGALRADVVARDELVLVVPPSHEWAHRGAITPSVLARTPLIVRELGSGTRLNAEQIMTDAGYPPVPPLVELPTTAAIRTAVEAGAGVAILSILAVRDDIAAGRLVRVQVRRIRFVRELRAIYPQASSLPPELQTLLAVASRIG